ncbi:MAG: phosphatase PAP2 family protein [Flavobacteriaceae bacterium]|nr:phosphatase PAP2 family protein [Flavobacteriaceae bacterium]
MQQSLLNRFLISVSYIFHPLYMPLAGCLIYFNFSPRYIPTEYQYTLLTATLLILIVFPVLLFLLFKKLRWITDFEIRLLKERRYPVIVYISLIYICIRSLISEQSLYELYYFFVGILLSLIATLICIFFKHKTSLHTMGVSGLWAYVIFLSIYYRIDLLWLIIVLSVAIGLVATSRLAMNAHKPYELISGFIFGVIPQLLMVNYYYIHL